ncbi:MAG: hypothetical protein M0R03_21905 [Novosphingobium sp.]|nr:hypothetical protein [Novosphingobium sp.]
MKPIIVTPRILKRRDICNEAIEIFKKVFPEEKAEFTVKNLKKYAKVFKKEFKGGPYQLSKGKNWNFAIGMYNLLLNRKRYEELETYFDKKSPTPVWGPHKSIAIDKQIEKVEKFFQKQKKLQ